MKKQTHGEVWYKLKKEQKNSTYCIPDRMGYKEAVKYYKIKFARYFERQVTIKDFKNVEDYFSYFEALKIRDIVEKIKQN